MENTRPYRGINNRWWDAQKMSAIDKLLLIVLTLLVSGALWFCFNATPEKSQRLVPPVDRAEISRRLDARGLSRATTVEITESGYRAEFNGEWVKLKPVPMKQGKPLPGSG